MASAGWNKLNKAMQTLSEKWDQTETGWRDMKRIEFEKDCIRPIESRVAASLRAMLQLSEVLARVRRECQDDRE